MRNFVVMHIGGEPWTLAGLLVVVSGVGFVVWVGLVVLLAPRWGKVRALSASEAAQVAVNPAEPGYVDRLVPVHGPAHGVEASSSFSIGTLREAWQAKDYVRFIGLPGMMIMFAAILEGFLVAVHLATRGELFWMLFALPNLMVAPMFFGAFFMMWAAVYTNLE